MRPRGATIWYYQKAKGSDKDIIKTRTIKVVAPMNWKTRLSSSLFVLTVSACGGGGGGESAPPEPAPPEPAPTQFTVTAEAGIGGSISPASVTVDEGASTTFTVQPDTGYEISSVTGCSGTLDGLIYSTAAITSDCHVNAEFSTSSGQSDPDAPVASILFPWTVSRSDQNTLTVKGVASDSDKITAVRVNGTPATLSSTAIQAFAYPSPISSSSPVGSGTAESGGDQVEWEATIELTADSDTTIVVETEDEAGNVESSADRAQVITRAVPIQFAIDAERRRLVGQPWHDQIVIMGLDDRSYQSLKFDDQPYCQGLGLRSDLNQVICSNLFNDQLDITAISLDTTEQQFLIGYPLQLDPAEWSFANVRETRVSRDNTALFILLTYFSATEYSLNKSVILRYDFASSTMTTVVDGTTDSGKKVASDNFALAESGLLLFNGHWGVDSGDDSLQLVDYAGADAQSVSAPFNLLLAGIDLDSTDTWAYMAGYEGIARANILDGTQEVLSLEADELQFNVDQVSSIGVDEINNRLLVSDSGYNYIFSVDLETGTRNEFASNGVGKGKHLLAPGALQLDETNGRAFLLDDGGNARAALFSVDLETGDRSVITYFDHDCNHAARGLDYDPGTGRLFATFTHAVVEVAIETGEVTPLAPASTSTNDCSGSSYQFSGSTLDMASNRLLVTETGNDAVMAVDLATKIITSIHSSSSIDVPVDVALDSASGNLYIASQSNGDIHVFSPETGELTLLLDSCLDENGQDAMDINVGGIHGITMDPAAPVMWITGDRLLRFDLEAGNCSAMRWRYFGYGLVSNRGIMDLAITENRQLLGTKSKQMVQVDFESGELVTISK